MTREEYEIEQQPWFTQNYVSPAQKEYEDSLPEPKEIEGVPF